MVEDLPQRGGTEADQVAGKKTFVEVLFGKAKKSQVEISPAVFTRADRVGLCDQMAFIPVAEDEPIGAKLFFPINSIRGGKRFGGGVHPIRGSRSATSSR